MVISSLVTNCTRRAVAGGLAAAAVVVNGPQLEGVCRGQHLQHNELNHDHHKMDGHKVESEESQTVRLNYILN